MVDATLAALTMETLFFHPIFNKRIATAASIGMMANNRNNAHGQAIISVGKHESAIAGVAEIKKRDTSFSRTMPLKVARWTVTSPQGYCRDTVVSWSSVV